MGSTASDRDETNCSKLEFLLSGSVSHLETLPLQFDRTSVTGLREILAIRTNSYVACRMT